MARSIYQKYRYSLILLRELVITEFKLRYQGSVLGYLWSLLKPLFLFVILYFVFVYFLKTGSNVPHWPVALFVGIVLWNFFSEITNNGLGSVVGRGDVIRKINFPKYVIVLASSISALVNLVLNFVIVAIFMIFTGVDITWTALFAPLYILELFVFGVGLALILSTIFVKLRDMNYIWEIIMQALFYGSAIIYPISIIVERSSTLGQLLLLNPVSQAIQDVRHVLVDPANMTLYSVSQSVLISLIPLAIVLVVALFGGFYFKRRSPYFAEDI